jgi:hypothetical protein
VAEGEQAGTAEKPIGTQARDGGPAFCGIENFLSLWLRKALPSGQGSSQVRRGEPGHFSVDVFNMNPPG